VEALRPLDAHGAELLSALAHHLRTPLTSALGYLELLTDESLGPLTAEQDRVLRTVGASVERLARMVDELDPAARRPPPHGSGAARAVDGAQVRSAARAADVPPREPADGA
jgi:light-regulated signal transduction histidine kinase (bacteriophytochrome)